MSKPKSKTEMHLSVICGLLIIAAIAACMFTAWALEAFLT